MGQRIDLPLLSGVAGYRQITPTDVAQFIRLEQCERYLRLRLHTRGMGAGFMEAYGVVPQSIPPLLTRSGERFEDRIERLQRRRGDLRSFTALDEPPATHLHRALIGKVSVQGGA